MTAQRLRNYEAGSPWQSELDKIELLLRGHPEGSLNHELKGDPDDANIVIGPK